MHLLSAMLRPYARWLAILAILPLLAGHVALEGRDRSDDRIMLVAERARIAAAVPVQVRTSRRVSTATSPRLIASIPATPQLHRSDCRRCRAPPMA